MNETYELVRDIAAFCGFIFGVLAFLWCAENWGIS